MSWCLMSSDVIWHIRDKLWPMPKHGSIKSTYVRCMRVLAVTCHLHFWQNDRDFLRATVVTRGWNGYRNKSQHRKSTLEKKILPPFQQGFEPATFQSRVWCSNHWAIPAPMNPLGPLMSFIYNIFPIIQSVNMSTFPWYLMWLLFHNKVGTGTEGSWQFKSSHVFNTALQKWALVLVPTIKPRLCYIVSASLLALHTGVNSKVESQFLTELV